MAVVQKYSGQCFGRYFTGTPGSGSAGFMCEFKDWIVKTPENGGPGWHILSDHSLDGTEPYIIISDTPLENIVINSWNNGPGGYAQKIIKCGYTTSTSAKVYFEQYSTYHGGVLYNMFGRFEHRYLSTIDDGEFSFRFCGGTEFLTVATAFSKDVHVRHFDVVIADTGVFPAASKVGILSGSSVNGGTSGAYTSTFSVGTGQSSNFFVGERILLTDFNGHEWVETGEITNIDPMTDSITVIKKSRYKKNWPGTWPNGTLIGAFPARLATHTSDLPGSVLLPYSSSFDNYNDAYTGMFRAYGEFSNKSSPFNNNNVKYDLKRFVMRPLIHRTFYSDGYNQYGGYVILGYMKNCYLGGEAGLALSVDGISIGSKSYAYLDDGHINFFPDYTENT